MARRLPALVSAIATLQLLAEAVQAEPPKGAAEPPGEFGFRLIVGDQHAGATISASGEAAAAEVHHQQHRAAAVAAAAAAAAAAASSSSHSALIRSEPRLQVAARATATAVEAPRSQQPASTSATSDACVWQDWKDWTTCTQSCNGGVQTRSRVPQNGVDPKFCDGSATVQMTCNANGCPVDCKWSEWDNWDKCTRDCGGGVMHRNRRVMVADEWGGKPCNGSNTQEEACNMQSCPIDCKWGDWGSWQACSATCDGGVSLRNRSIASQAQYGGQNCSGSTQDSQPCNVQGCPVNCVWSPWGGWSSCTKSCGTGKSVRGRSISVKQLNNGAPCDGEASQTIDCNTDGCPVHCQWSDWTPWTTCTKSCGGGDTSRQRTQTTQAAFGGRACDGPNVQNDRCNREACPVDCQWQDWQQWGGCSLTCGTGVKVRTRAKFVEANGGKPCLGAGVENGQCSNYANCPLDTLPLSVDSSSTGTTTTTWIPDVRGEIYLSVSDPDTFIASNDVEDSMAESISILASVTVGLVEAFLLKPPPGQLLDAGLSLAQEADEPSSVRERIRLAQKRWLTANGMSRAMAQEQPEEGSRPVQEEKPRAQPAQEAKQAPTTTTQGEWRQKVYGVVLLRYIIHKAPDTAIKAMEAVTPTSIAAVLASALARHQLTFSVEVVSLDIPNNPNGKTTTTTTSVTTTTDTTTPFKGIMSKVFSSVFGTTNTSKGNVTNGTNSTGNLSAKQAAIADILGLNGAATGSASFAPLALALALAAAVAQAL